jgi:hypothetical protein
VVLVSSVFLFLSGAATQPSNVPTLVPPEVVAEQVKACGFDQVRV